MTKNNIQTEEMTANEYRDKIMSIFENMDSIDKLRFWYIHISTIEMGEG